jgi:hypothetical protein
MAEEEVVESTNQIVRNQDFDPSTFHTRGQSPKAFTLQKSYIATLFDQDDGFSKEV